MSVYRTAAGPVRSRPLAHYAVALVAVGVAMAVTVALRPVLERNVFSVFLAAIALSAWLGRLRGGLAAVALTLLGAGLLVRHPALSLYGTDTADLIALAVVALVGTFVSALVHGLARAREDAEQSRGEAAELAGRLQEQAAELEEQTAELAAINDELVRLTVVADSARDTAEKSVALLDALFDTAPVGLAYLDRDLRFARVNRFLAEMTGLPPEELMGRRMAEVLPDADRGALRDLRSVLESGEAWECEVTGEVPSAPGVARTWWMAYYPIRRDSGEVIGVGAAVDEITERRRAREALEDARSEAERQARENRLLLESTGEGIYGVDTEGRCTFINRSGAAMVGREAVECIGRNVHELLHHRRADGGAYPEAECPLSQAFRGGEGVRLVGEVFWRKDGSYFPVECSAYPIVADGATRGAVVTFSDITNRWQAAEALRESEERFRSAFEDAAIGMALVAPDGRWLKANRALTEILGYSEEALLRMDWQAVSHPDEQRENLEEGRRALDGELRTYRIDARFRHRRGYWVWTLLSVSLVRNAEGAPLYFVAQLQDISESKRAHEALRESEARYRLLVDAAPVSMWLDTAEGDPVYHNLRYRAFTGLSPEGLVRGDGWEAIHPDDRLRAAQARDTGIADGAPYEVELRLRRHDGEYCWHRVRVVPAKDGNGRVTAWIGAAADIDATYRAHAAADAANRAKSQFLATMSHEIRTPINAIIGYVDLLGLGVAGPPNEQQSAYLERIRGSSRHLLTLVNDVLDLAKIEAGEMHVGRERVSVRGTVVEALAIAEPLLREKGLTLDDRTTQAGALQYWGDPDRVRQVLVNLLSNAAKFTESGGVELRAGTASAPPSSDSAQDGPWIAIEVEDTGIGIAPDEMERIFDPFVQADGSYRRTRQGTGLGLAISRSLALNMGGDLTAVSTPGRGSRFTLWLSRAVPDDPAPPDRRSAGERRSGVDRREG